MKLSAPLSRLRSAMGAFILSSLLIGFLCISCVHSVSAHAGMDMSHSVNTNSSVIVTNCCDGSASNHMELWKSTLVGIFETVQSLLVLFVVSYVATVAFSELFNTPRLSINLFAVRFRQYAREHPNIGLFDPLRLALARGILNPKLF
jgi:hypothetical protein